MSTYQTLGVMLEFYVKTLFHFQKNHFKDELLLIHMKVCPFVFPSAALQCHYEKKWL